MSSTIWWIVYGVGYVIAIRPAYWLVTSDDSDIFRNDRGMLYMSYFLAMLFAFFWPLGFAVWGVSKLLPGVYESRRELGIGEKP